MPKYSINPWSDLSTPKKSGDFFSKRVNISTPHDFKWAQNFNGQYCMMFICASDEPVKVDKISLRNINLISHFRNKEITVIVELLDDTARDLFRVMCHDLIDSVSKVSINNPALVIKLFITRLKRWQDLFGKGNKNLLSQSQQIGLIGELFFLRDYLLAHLDQNTALSCWQGPTGSEQDFLFSENLFEIKTQLSSSDKKISISSLEQLDDISGVIWLLHQTITTDVIEISNFQSLFQLIKEIRSVLEQNIFALDLLESNLLAYGYIDREEYDEVSYTLNNRHIFLVDDKFPKITRSDTSPLIIRASYMIDIAGVINLEILEQDFLKKVF